MRARATLPREWTGGVGPRGVTAKKFSEGRGGGGALPGRCADVPFPFVDNAADVTARRALIGRGRVGGKRYRLGKCSGDFGACVVEWGDGLRGGAIGVRRFSKNVVPWSREISVY